MFKIFGVGEDEDFKKSNIIGVETKDDNSIDEEVGQIALDILERDDGMIIVAPIAGVVLSDIDLYLNKNILTLRGKRDKPSDIYDNNNIKIRNSECFWGKFVRNIILPENLNFKEIKAVMENNLLVVTIAKQVLDSQNIKINEIGI